MSKVLILSTTCYGKASANGLCAMALKQALEKEGVSVDIIGFRDSEGIGGDESQGEYDVGGAYQDFTKKSLYKSIKSRVYALFYQNFNTGILKAYYSKAYKLNKENSYDAILTTYFLPEFVEVGRKIKRQFTNVKLFIYELDSATDGIQGQSRMKRLYDRGIIRWLKDAYKKADRVFIMKCHSQHVKDTYEKVLRNKLSIVDLPVLEVKKEKQVSVETIDILYTGVLDKNYRSPNKVLELFSKTSRKDLRLHFYSKGDCEDIVKEYAEKDKRIYQHGYVASQELESAVMNASFLVNIGNANSNSLPSKLIGYISSGKPIIHVSLQKEDVCRRYLEKYPLAFWIDEISEPVIEQFEQFLNDNIGKRVSDTEIMQQFECCTPAYSAKKIKKYL